MAEAMSDDHLERLEALLKHSPGILWEGLNTSEVGDVRACLGELKQARALLAEAREEWAVRWPTAGGGYAYELCEDEQDAREAIPDDDYTCEIVKRFVGGWQQVEQ